LDRDLTAAVGFGILFVLMALGVPIGIAMGIVGVAGFAMLVGLDPALSQVGIATLSTVTNYAFGLVPLFLLMGQIATQSGLSNELYSAARAWVGHRRGGLAMATIVACGGFSAICGSSVATAATMAKVAVPEMRDSGYSKSVACGVVAAGGTLGILIPPSVVLAIYGIIVEQDIGVLFIAGIVPGLVAVIMYLATLQIIAWARPSSLPVGRRSEWRERWLTLRDVWATAVLFVLVLGGIYGGIFSPTEAAGVGAFGAFLIALFRQRLTVRTLLQSLAMTVRTTGSVFTILIGAILFGYFLAVTQAPQNLANFVAELPIGRYGTIAIILFGYLILGCILDSLAMVILTVPIVFPIISKLGFDPIWFGVIIVVTVELGLITPPLGMNVFVINGTIRDAQISEIFRGVAPFVLCDIVRLAAFVAFPAIVLFLPRSMG
jgi:tripartite ATP-independent transporter DctM subunit